MSQENNDLCRLSDYVALLFETGVRHILEEHVDAVRRYDRSNAFTVFEIISDLYYRENFHSDMIAFLLNPEQNHGYKLLGLNLFIELINRITGWRIRVSDFCNAVVSREEGTKESKIDILIKDEQTKHAIFIENKMNNAQDTDRQIPRYCEILDERRYLVDAAVYLPLTRFKEPDKSTWEEEDHLWDDKIVIIPAVSDREDFSLVRDWLEVLSKWKDINPDVASTIRQYSYLITKLSNQEMDKESYKKLYEYLMEGKGDNYDKALSFVSMMNNLPQYLAQRIYDSYNGRCDPFEGIRLYKDSTVVFEPCMIDGIGFTMDVRCHSIDHYDIVIFVRYPEVQALPDSYDSIKDFLRGKGIKAFDNFNVDEQYCISKELPLKESIDDFIDSILEQLKTVCKSVQ